MSASLFDISTKLKQKATVLEKNPEKCIFFGALVEDYEAVVETLALRGWRGASAALSAAQPVLGGRSSLRLPQVSEGDPVALSRALATVPDVCRSLDAVYDVLDAAFDAATQPGRQGTVSFDQAVAQGVVADGGTGTADRSRGPAPLSNLSAEEVARLMDDGAPDIEEAVPSMFSRSSNIPRPQVHFATRPQNANVVRLHRRAGTAAPTATTSDMGRRINSTSDLPSMLASHIVASLRVPLDEAEVRESYSAHPYAADLAALDDLWAGDVDRWLSAPETVRPVVPLADTQLVFVSTRDELRTLVEDLARASEFAIDLEHNAFRSYEGLVCLMQVSVEGTDYLIDTLALRDDLAPLQPSFANPDKLKIMHGADSDVLWLQENFGLYLVNVFDTGQAARVLELPSAKLSSLLETYCSVTADKTYQTADWRLRPLPPIMLHYAREDTHYLFHLYDRLRVDLDAAQDGTEGSSIAEVRRRSRDVTARLAESSITHTASARLHAARLGSRALFTPRAAAAYSAVYYWRDAVARVADESPSYVASNDALLAIATARPTDVPGLLRAAGRAASPLLRSRATELIDILSRVLALLPAEEDGTTEPVHVADGWCLPCPAGQMVPASVPAALRPVTVRAVEDARGQLYMQPVPTVDPASGRWLYEEERQNALAAQVSATEEGAIPSLRSCRIADRDVAFCDNEAVLSPATRGDDVGGDVGAEDGSGDEDGDGRPRHSTVVAPTRPDPVFGVGADSLVGTSRLPATETVTVLRPAATVAHDALAAAARAVAAASVGQVRMCPASQTRRRPVRDGDDDEDDEEKSSSAAATEAGESIEGDEVAIIDATTNTAYFHPESGQLVLPPSVVEQYGGKLKKKTKRKREREAAEDEETAAAAAAAAAAATPGDGGDEGRLQPSSTMEAAEAFLASVARAPSSSRSTDTFEVETEVAAPTKKKRTRIMAGAIDMVARAGSAMRGNGGGDKGKKAKKKGGEEK